MIVVSLVFIILVLVKLLRWLALVQQKEYRLDRLFNYMRTDEGFVEVIFFPKLNNLTWTGLKRPVVTSRVVTVGVISIFLLVVFSVGLSSVYSGGVELLISYLLLYFFLPAIVVFSTLPSFLVLHLVSLLLLKKASVILSKKNPIIIGITGSYGKTSTKILLAQVLKSKFSVFSTPASHNTKYSISKSILSGYKGEEIVIIEFAAYKKGEIKKLTEYFPPNHALLTGIAVQHIELFGSMKELLEAKSELVQALKRKGLVFYSGLDKGSVQICEKIKNRRVDFSGIKSSVKLSSVKLDKMGKISFNWGKNEVKTKITGKHYLTNIKAVIAVGGYFKLTKDQIIKSLESFIPPASFVQTKVGESGVMLIDDSGTSNPKGFESAVELVEKLNRKKKILLFGGIVDLGLESSDVHRSLAEVSKAVFSKVLYVGGVGKNEFKQVFKDKFVDDQKLILKELKKCNKDSLLLIEGKIPVLITKHLTIQ